MSSLVRRTNHVDRVPITPPSLSAGPFDLIRRSVAPPPPALKSHQIEAARHRAEDESHRRS